MDSLKNGINPELSIEDFVLKIAEENNIEELLEDPKERDSLIEDLKKDAFYKKMIEWKEKKN